MVNLGDVAYRTTLRAVDKVCTERHTLGGLGNAAMNESLTTTKLRLENPKTIHFSPHLSIF